MPYKQEVEGAEPSSLNILSSISKHQQGNGNSHYGHCWIYNEKTMQSKSIKKEELQNWLDNGWKKGRINTWNK